MFKTNITTIVTLSSLFFALNINAQIRPIISPSLNINPVEVSTSGYQKGLVAELFNMTGAETFSSSPQFNSPNRSYVEGVPPFTSNPSQSMSGSDNSGVMATKWNGFIRTTIPGIYTFDLSATGLSATSGCLASIDIDSKGKKQIRFTPASLESLNFKLTLAAGMRSVSMWLHCDEGQVRLGQVARSDVKLELKRIVPGGRNLVALVTSDYYSKIPDDTF